MPELQAKGYQYWALGHVHEHWIERGETTIAYPGNLQGRHIKETGARGALIVTVDAGEITEIERLEVDVLRWHLLAVDVSTAVDLRTAVRAVGAALEQLLSQAPSSQPLAVRVNLSGQCAAHAALISADEQLRQEVIAQAVALDPDRLWIEKVRVSTTGLPSQAAQLAEESQDALQALHTLAATADEDADFLQSLQADWQALLEKIPHEVLQAAPELAELRQASPALIADRLRQATPILMARIGQGGQAAS